MKRTRAQRRRMRAGYTHEAAPQASASVIAMLSVLLKRKPLIHNGRKP